MSVCPNCSKDFEKQGKRKFCCSRCANTYRARASRQEEIQKKYDSGFYVTKCKHCDKHIERPKKFFCSDSCKNLYNVKHKYKSKYSNRFISKDADTFIRSLMSYFSRRETLPLEYVQDIYKHQNGLCAISGVEMTHIRGHGKVPTNISIDRIDSSKEYEIGNIQLVCHYVNTMKMAQTTETLQWWCEKIVENRKLPLKAYKNE